MTEVGGGKPQLLFQDQAKVFEVGQQVVCSGTTSCGLVMAFGSEGKVACYHWPFMTNSQERHNTFKEVVDKLGERPKLIVVITNDFTSDAQARDYKRTVEVISLNWKRIPIKYYVHDKQIKGQDPWVTLGPDGAKSHWDVRQVEFMT